MTPEEKKATRPVSEKASAWSNYVNKVYAELKAIDPKVKRSAAMALAKERRAAGLATITPLEAANKENLYVFKHKGRNYLRSTKNEVWLRNSNGSMGNWQGMYDPSTNSIIEAPEPVFEGGRRRSRKTLKSKRK